MEMPIKDYIKENYVSKKKIREKIKQLTQEQLYKKVWEREQIYLEIGVLEVLLEEEE